MSSDDEFDSDAYQAYEDQLYREHSSSGSENDVDSEIEETLLPCALCFFSAGIREVCSR